MGRNVKYKTQEEREEAIRISKARFARKSRKLKNLEKRIYEYQIEKFSYHYKSELVRWNNEEIYDVFFTATLNKLLDVDGRLLNRGKFSPSYLYSKVMDFFKKLMNSKIISKVFWTLEQDTDKSWHVHFVIKFKNQFISNRNGYLQKMWTFGLSKAITINDSMEQTKILKYMVKDIKADYRNLNCLYWAKVNEIDNLVDEVPEGFKEYLGSFLYEVL